MSNQNEENDPIAVIVATLFTLAFFIFLFLMARGIANSPVQQASEKARRYHERMKNEKWIQLNSMPEDDPRWANVY